MQDDSNDAINIEQIAAAAHSAPGRQTVPRAETKAVDIVNDAVQAQLPQPPGRTLNTNKKWIKKR